MYKKILQVSELCYVDALALFDPLNSLITLFYTSCAVRAFPLSLFIISDKFKIILEKAINLLKMILPLYAFFGCGLQIGLIVFLINNSSVEYNALELC